MECSRVGWDVRSETERGSATILMLGIVAMGFVLLVGMGKLVVATGLASRADAGADAVALSAADMIAMGKSESVALSVARKTAKANEVELADIDISKERVQVQVTVSKGGQTAHSKAVAEIDRVCGRVPGACDD